MIASAGSRQSDDRVAEERSRLLHDWLAAALALPAVQASPLLAAFATPPRGETTCEAAMARSASSGPQQPQQSPKQPPQQEVVPQQPWKHEQQLPQLSWTLAHPLRQSR